MFGYSSCPYIVHQRAEEVSPERVAEFQRMAICFEYRASRLVQYLCYLASKTLTESRGQLHYIQAMVATLVSPSVPRLTQ